MPDEDPYLCIGLCQPDPDSGHCLGCGRPPLPSPAAAENTPAEPEQAPPGAGAPAPSAADACPPHLDPKRSTT